jgi:hypothetical protein
MKEKIDVEKIRNEFPKSYFLPEVYDEFIIGIDILSDRVVYDYVESITRVDIYSDYKIFWDCQDFESNGIGFFKWFRIMCKDARKKKLRPPLMLMDKETMKYL